MRVLVLGGSGLIGEASVRALLAAGHQVTGLAREVSAAKASLGRAAWLSADLAGLSSPDAWTPILEGARPDAIVNSAGALQDGSRDDVAAMQSAAMQALYKALPGTGCRHLVQISATRAALDADTLFMRSKGEADEALRQSPLDWTILRPGLVISPQAYGGTALLRALAAMPYVVPVAFPDSAVQTVAVGDVAGAVVAAIEGRVPTRRTYDLVEDKPQPLRVVLTEMRAWLGLAPAPTLDVPAGVPRMLARIGDGLGWLGWRAPLRTTAVVELAAGIRGDPEPWRHVSATSLTPLTQTLAAMPSTVQERWFARCFMLKPLAIGVASLFWVATGLIAVANEAAAAQVLSERGISADIADALVLGGALADIGLGVAILVRAWSARASLGMLLLTLAYLAGGTLLAPDLWIDPLGPLLKALPVLVLSFAVLSLADDR